MMKGICVCATFFALLCRRCTAPLTEGKERATAKCEPSFLGSQMPWLFLQQGNDGWQNVFDSHAQSMPVGFHASSLAGISIGRLQRRPNWSGTGV